MKPAIEAPITFPEPNHLEEDNAERVSMLALAHFCRGRDQLQH